MIERSEYQEVIDENRDRVMADPDYYRIRQQITEHQFATIKRQWGFTHTLMKAKEYVLSEVHLLFMIYNLRRNMSVLGLEELKKRLKILIDSIFDTTLLLMRFFSLLMSFHQMIYRGILFKTKIKYPQIAIIDQI